MLLTPFLVLLTFKEGFRLFFSGGGGKKGLLARDLQKYFWVKGRERKQEGIFGVVLLLLVL